MFYIVECSDRILVVTENPVNSDGQLNDEFLDYYFGGDDAGLKYDQEDIVQIVGPMGEAEITTSSRISPTRQTNLVNELSYDPDAGEWTE